LKGVVAFAPVWFPLSTFAAIPILNLPIVVAPDFYVYALFYEYSHAELWDGAGHGTDMIHAGKQDTVRSMLTTMCAGQLSSTVASLGPDASDLYDATWLDDPAACAAERLPAECDNDLARKWIPRMAADRPALDATGAPVLVWQGDRDATVPPDRAKCG